MKIIGLMPVKNEAWILPTTIPQLQKFVDEILVLDTGSSDGSQEILAKMGVDVKAGFYHPDHQNNYAVWRNALLNWGRERNGTHFIWLDADEAFTSHFQLRPYLKKLKPGQKLLMDWLCLWKSPFHLRSDPCVWRKITKDFVVCDDGISRFCEKQVRHEGRTPGSSHINDQILIPRKEGAVLHFQFVPFQRFQMKQAFQRVREYFEDHRLVLSINRNYAITLDDPKARCSPLPSEWYQGMVGLDRLSDALVGWYEEAILEFFSKNSIEWFEPLQIWHIPSLREKFVKEVGREPVSMEIPRLLKLKSYVRNRVIPFLKGYL